MKGIIFDLEHNQPTPSIIQIGAVLCDYKKRTIVKRFNRYCLLPKGEILDPYIQDLCDIPEDFLEEHGISFVSAVNEFWTWVHDCNCGGNIAAWSKDLIVLEKQSREAGVTPPTNLHSLDLKEMGKLFRIPKGSKAKGGLQNTMQLFNLTFKGRPHDGLTDSENTAMLVFHWLKLLDTVYKAQDIFVGV